jgi:alkanesulfonate monooxygenase SsuD/methylene tetrahydromethanopterin reductase-like flavin-dependent oxidoreductase (luciferase family)
MFFIAVGVLSWIWALAVLWIFAESGGALTVIAAGIFAIVAMVALGFERILKALEDLRDGRRATTADAAVIVTPKVTPAPRAVVYETAATADRVVASV